MVSNTTQHPLHPRPHHTLSAFTLSQGARVELETMPLNISWNDFQEKITNALASYLIYALQ